MLNGIGVKNLRSFSEFIHSPLKPLTVYLGRNSSGKSSLIRLLPLLRQSVEETTTGPILWYGRYVDYGNFNEAICKEKKHNNTITLQFNLMIDTTYGHLWFDLPSSNRFPLLDFKLEIQLSEHNQKTYAKSIRFEIDDSYIEVTPDFEKNITTVDAGGLSGSFRLTNNGAEKKDYKFLPILSWSIDSGKKNMKESSEEQKALTMEYNKLIYRRQVLEKEKSYNKHICEFASKQLKSFFHHNTNPKNISDELLNVRAFSKDRLEHGVFSLFKKHAYFNKQMENPELRERFINILHPLILLKNYNSIADLINTSLTKSLRSVKYLAPIRANTERFYRFQDLQVDEMDHTGSNIAMILHSFTEIENKMFQEWTTESFGFIAFVTTDGSHYAIKIKTENDNDEHNISDMGYGYSQVLPIIMSIWLEILSADNSTDEIIFVIEQPELHLHPAYQAKVAYLFAKVINSAKKSKKDIKFIFETHSQSMVDAIGDCIQSNIIDKDDVNIMIFEKDKEKGSSAFTADFDDNGYFKNWPVGFFSGE